MEEIKLYDIDSSAFCELIDSAKMDLKKQNMEYTNLLNEISDIKQEFPNIRIILEDEDERGKALNETEGEMLKKILNLYEKMQNFEEQKIFFLGARENYFYFKNLGLIKD